MDSDTFNTPCKTQEAKLDNIQLQQLGCRDTALMADHAVMDAARLLGNDALQTLFEPLHAQYQELLDSFNNQDQRLTDVERLGHDHLFHISSLQEIIAGDLSKELTDRQEESGRVSESLERLIATTSIHNDRLSRIELLVHGLESSLERTDGSASAHSARLEEVESALKNALSTLKEYQGADEEQHHVHTQNIDELQSKLQREVEALKTTIALRLSKLTDEIMSQSYDMNLQNAIAITKDMAQTTARLSKLHEGLKNTKGRVQHSESNIDSLFKALQTQAEIIEQEHSVLCARQTELEKANEQRWIDLEFQLNEIRSGLPSVYTDPLPSKTEEAPPTFGNTLACEIHAALETSDQGTLDDSDNEPLVVVNGVESPITRPDTSIG
ncbi:hypothetical protein D9611_009747 [Ephemerocybe angulata]|uniref:Uncharacterized protein n=1 Tax=Ephemerocybe angulata TaxID=980116 RepID=A0A8H5C5N3_9AGAR|nr:hypothetical protein D9611_009747 [Tulosesus angulatus]